MRLDIVCLSIWPQDDLNTEEEVHLANHKLLGEASLS